LRPKRRNCVASRIEGLDRRLERIGLAEGYTEADYRERLKTELDIIENMKFPGYFLIVADFIKWAKEQDIPVGPGRGSGAGSLVAYALTITDVDPLRFGLLFERFLNPARVSMPDFDIDFCQDRREEVIRYVQSKYGREQVGQIITFGSLQARAALRDVGRVLEMPYGLVDRICKLVPNNPANPTPLNKAIEEEPRFAEEMEKEPAVERLLDIAQKLEGLYRHASTHAAGIVIGDRPLSELVPMYRDPRSDMPVTQFNMKWVEQAGLVKFDFLGLKTLTVLKTAVGFIAKRGITIDLEALPLDDKPTYEMLSRGETVGVFQVESAGMRKALIGMRPDRIEDIIALVALYRPGPMENIPVYNARKHGEEELASIHPKIDGLLAETQGVIVYQEQVMQIAQVLAGYSLGEADLLRRAMGKKIKEEMDKQRVRLRRRRGRARRLQAAGRHDLRPARQVRKLRLQQVARRRLRHRLLPDRLSQGALSGRVPRRLDDARHVQHRQARRFPPGRPPARHRGGAAFCADQLPSLRDRREQDLLRPGRHQGRRRRRRRAHCRGPWRHAVCLA
jgi:DNA polymerase-3 subunit alpha